MATLVHPSGVTETLPGDKFSWEMLHDLLNARNLESTIVPKQADNYSLVITIDTADVLADNITASERANTRVEGKAIFLKRGEIEYKR
jgi:hypothetical protein